MIILGIGEGFQKLIYLIKTFYKEKNNFEKLVKCHFYSPHHRGRRYKVFLLFSA